MTCDLKNKRVLILGYGREGQANLQFALSAGAREVAVADKSPSLALSSTDKSLIKTIFSGDNWLDWRSDSTTEYDLILRSPGVPMHTLGELSAQTKLSSGSAIFLEQMRDRVIGITGTKGKSTTSSLIFSVLKNAGLSVTLGGNIGISPISLLKGEYYALYVLELSSYQLQDLDVSPRIASILNLYPEHLDHHGSLSAYGSAKARIALSQRVEDTLVLPSDDSKLHELTARSPAQRTFWGDFEGSAWIENSYFYLRRDKRSVDKICPIAAPLLKGPGNQRNILATLAVTKDFNIPAKLLADSIVNFKPLEHRLEEVAVINGVTYINDSISTVPQATINAVETFGSVVTTVILGGFDRGIDYSELVDYLLRSRVRNIVLFPPSGARIKSAFLENPSYASSSLSILEVKTMPEAVAISSSLTASGEVCLLSPAAPSFPIFKNFEERGHAFKKEVLARRDR
jgi:UDP-N-acetylmuramoylalanine--D-glutamate ligase